MRKWAVVFALLIGPVLSAQTLNRNDRIQQASSLYKGAADYQLGPDDLIEIGVFGVSNFTHTLRIDASGMIRIPLLGEMPAAGLSTRELELKLESLLDGRLIRNPDVAVVVKEYRSQPVFILGAVTRPGQYHITQRLNLIDVLSMAGGLSANAADEISIKRRRHEANSGSVEPTTDSEVIQINLKALLESGEFSLNIPVQGGDVIHVPNRVTQVFYVIGEVTSAGSFQLTPKKTLLITEALALAGGPMKTAKKSNGILVRYDEHGKRQELPVDFSAILKGKKPDFPVHANDIIFIPGSTFKNIGYGMLGVIPTTISTAIVR